MFLLFILVFLSIFLIVCFVLFVWALVFSIRHEARIQRAKRAAKTEGAS